MLYDKRKLERYDVFLIVEFKPLNSAVRHSIGITRNLSSEGFSMESQGFDFECGETLEFRLKHPGSNLSVSLVGNIVWKKLAWYKHIIGVKLVEVSEESKSKILALISAVKEVTEESARINDEIESAPEREEVEKPVVEQVAGKSDELVPDTSETERSEVDLNETDDSEPLGMESAVVAGAEFDVNDDKVADKGPSPEAVQETSVNGAVEETAHNEKIEKELEQIYGEQNEKEREISPAQNTTLNTNAVEKKQKKAAWLYVPVIIFALIIFAIALPKVINNYKNSFQSENSMTEESVSYQNTDKGGDQLADNDQADGQSLQYPYGPLQFQSSHGKNSMQLEQEASADLSQLSAEADLDKNTSTASPAKSGLNSEKMKENVPRVEIGSILKYESFVSKDEIPVSTQIADKGKQFKTELIAKQDNPPKANSVQRSEQAITPEQGIKIKDIDKSELTVKSIETQKTVPVDMTDKKPEPFLTVPIVQTESRRENVLIEKREKPQEAVITTKEETRKVELADKAAEKSKTELTAKIEKPGKPEPATVKGMTQKAEPVDKMSKLPKIALLVTPNKLKESQNTSQSKTSKDTNDDSIKRWKNIGLTKDGIPLFIDSGNMSYPSEHVVKLMVKASVNKKDFIDLLEINCIQTKLRKLEERTGNNPVLSAYSNEWRDIIPESMLLYNAACPKQK